MKAIRSRFNSGRTALLAVMLVAVAVLAAACSGDGDTPKGGLQLAGLTDVQVEAFARGTAIGYPGATSNSGIHVTGVGGVTTKPDLAIVSLGVEAFAPTVAEATGEAANGISGILSALGGLGITEDDIATQQFNIQPEYTYVEIYEEVKPTKIKPLPQGEPAPPRDGVSSLSAPRRIRRTERTLIGYRVTNTLTIKVRDLDSIGAAIDGAVTAGGDETRINSIRFTIEDGESIEAQARLLALEDAVAKADLFAEQTGVSRGKLVFITESSRPQFANQSRVEFAAADGSAFAKAAPTAILAGESTVRVTVQAVFSID